MRYWHIIILVLMMAMVAVPFAVAEREHPMHSGDTIAHVEATKAHVWQYPAQMLSEIPVTLGGNNPLKAMLWFDISMLLLAMATLYFVFSRLVSKWAGVMAVVLAVFCSTGIASLFFAGAIFSVINVYILLPLGLYFLIRWLEQQRIYQIALSLLFMVAACVIHPTGIYIPLLLLVLSGALMLIKQYRKKGLIVFAFTVVTSCAALFAVGIPYMEHYLWNPVAPPISAGIFLKQYLSIPTAVLLIAGVFLFAVSKKERSFKSKLTIIGLLSFAVVLVPLAFTAISRDPGRQAIDLASVAALLAASLLGIVVRNKQYPVLSPALMLVAFVGAIPLIKVWIMGGTV